MAPGTGSAAIKKNFAWPGGIHPVIICTLMVNLSYHDRTIKEKVYILSDQTCSFLSKRACVELGMVKRIDTLANSSTPNFTGEFPGLFSCLGTEREDACPSTHQGKLPIH